MTDVLTEFKRLGDKASFHYADDSMQEWNLAHAAEAEALRLYDEHPELEDEMRKIALGFLWSLQSKRPPAMECPACKGISLRLKRRYQGMEDGTMFNDYECYECGHTETIPGSLPLS